MKRNVFLLLLTIGSLLNADDLWLKAINLTTSPELIPEFFTSEESVTDEDGEMQDHSYYKYHINRDKNILILEANKNGTALSSNKIRDLEKEMKESDNFLTDNFNLFTEEVLNDVTYYDTQKIEEIDGVTYYIYNYQFEDYIEGKVWFNSDGIPLKSTYILHSLPVDMNEYELLENSGETYYSSTELGVVVNRFIENSVIDYPFLFSKIKLYVKNEYYFWNYFE